MTRCCDWSFRRALVTGGKKKEEWNCCAQTTRKTCTGHHVRALQLAAVLVDLDPEKAQSNPCSTHCSICAPRVDELNNSRRQFKACRRQSHDLPLPLHGAIICGSKQRLQCACEQRSVQDGSDGKGHRRRAANSGGFVRECSRHGNCQPEGRQVQETRIGASGGV
jgi:hypothetical protein